MLKPFRLCLPLILMILLGGCFMAPGSTLKTGGAENRSWFTDGNGVWFPGLGESVPASQPPLEDLIDILPITPELLAAQQAQRAVQSASVSPQLLQQIENYDYFIGKGDVLHITVYDHPELTIPAGNLRSVEESGNIVRSDGTIYYPYIGTVEVEGMQVEQVRNEITDRLAEFVTQPQVDVKVVSFRSQRAYVTGQVIQPGPQPITNVPLTVLDAISRAGGLTDAANWHGVVLARENGEEIRLSLNAMLNEGRLDQNLLLRHGDVLHVPDIGNQKIFVLGELNRIDSLPVGSLSMSLTDALSQSGGINQVSANAKGVFVIRQTEGESDKLATVYQLDASNALAFALGSRFMLQPEDIVFVTTAPITRWNRVLSQIVPSLSSLILLDNLGGN